MGKIHTYKYYVWCDALLKYMAGDIVKYVITFII